MQVIVLADGDVGPRAALDAAWPGWLEPGARVVAADGGARHAAPLGLRDRSLGRRRRLARRRRHRRARGGRRPGRARPAGQGRVGHGARGPGRAARWAPTTLTIARRARRAAARPRPRQPRPPAMPELDGLGVRLVAADARVRLLRGPGADGGPATLDLGGRVGDLVSLLPVGADAEGVTTDGLRYPLRDEPLLVGPDARPLERPERGRRRPSSLAARPAPRRRDPCYALTHDHADRRRPGPRRSPCPTRRAPSTASPTSAGAGPSSTSIPRTTRPAAPSRPASSATPTRRSPSAAPTSGASARRARPASGRSARSSACRSRSSPTRTTGRRGLRLAGSRSRTTARRTGARRGRRSSSIRTAGSPASGRRSSRRATRPTSWPRSTSSRPPRMTRRAPEQRQEASLVGGDERSLGRKRTPRARVLATRRATPHDHRR